MATLKSGWFDHPRFASAVTGSKVIKAGDTGPAVKTVQLAEESWPEESWPGSDRKRDRQFGEVSVVNHPS